MIDLNIIEHMKTLTSSYSTFSNNNLSRKDFYSILLKHQISMIEAWSPKKSDSLAGINSGQLTEAFLKLKDIQKNSMLKPSIDSQMALKKYQNEKTTKESSSIFKGYFGFVKIPCLTKESRFTTVPDFKSFKAETFITVKDF